MEASSGLPLPARSGGLPLRSQLAGDERLARSVAGGNDRAFATLYERYHQPLYRYCRSILRNESDAQDALQSAFAAALVALRRGQRDAPLRPWLFRIAHNEAISLIRRERRADVEPLSDNAPATTASAEEEVAQRERLALLFSDLRELPDRQRGALVMRELSGLSHQEIADALQTSLGTAKQAIFEAREALLEFGEGRAMACDQVCRAISDGDRRVLRGRRVRAHLRGCASCAAFAAAIPARKNDLNAIAPPLAPLAAAGILAKVTAAGSAPAAGSGGAAGVAVATAGKLAGLSFAAKALVGVALVAGATAGVGTVVSISDHAAGTQSSSAAARHASGSAAGALHGKSHQTNFANHGAGAGKHSGSNGTASAPGQTHVFTRHASATGLAHGRALALGHYKTTHGKALANGHTTHTRAHRHVGRKTGHTAARRHRRHVVVHKPTPVRTPPPTANTGGNGRGGLTTTTPTTTTPSGKTPAVPRTKS